jgi:hypothetical protein
MWGLHMDGDLIRYVPEYEDATQAKLDHYIKRLPLVVPGLEVVRSTLEPSPFCRSNRSVIWFKWSYKAMDARYRDIVARHGIADPRLDYMECSGKREGKYQLTLTGMPEVEPRAHGGGGLFVAWAPLGLGMMESGFCQRICDPDRGGPECIPFDQTVRYQHDWWLVGSRGDSEEVMELEILASPLEDEAKDNLLFNLRRYRRAA